MYSDRVEGCLVEAGPDSFLTEKPWAATLCKELGIADQLIGSNDAQRKTYIVVNGRLVAMPDGLMFMVPTQAGADRAVAAVLVEHQAAHGARAAASAAAHAGRRNGGAAGGASFRGGGGGSPGRSAALGRLWRRCQQAQRARRAAALRRDGREVRQPEPRHAGGAQEDGGRWRKAAAAAAVHFAARTACSRWWTPSSPASIPNPFACARTSAASIPQNGGWRVAIEMNGDERFDAVILATPANVAGDVAGRRRPRPRATTCSDITYSSSVTVTLGYYMDQLAASAAGLRFPGAAQRRHAHAGLHLRPQQVSPSRARGQRHPALLPGRRARRGRARLSATTRCWRRCAANSRDILKLDARPIFARVYRWRGAMAQYEPGTSRASQRIEKRVAEIPGLAWPATPIMASACPTAFAPAWKRRQHSGALAELALESLTARFQHDYFKLSPRISSLRKLRASLFCHITASFSPESYVS